MARRRGRRSGSRPATGPNRRSEPQHRVGGWLDWLRTKALRFLSSLASDKTFALTLVGLVLVLALVVFQLYRGLTVQKIGIPGGFEIEFGPQEQQSPTQASATPLPDQLQVADFSDTRRWYLSRSEWVRPIFDPGSGEQNAILRFYPPGRDITVRAFRKPMDDLPTHEYCAAELDVRLQLPEGGFNAQHPPTAYVIQNGEKLTASFLPALIQGATGWQTVLVPFRDMRSEKGASWSERQPVSEFGIELSLPTAGGTVDIDNVVFRRCST